METITVTNTSSRSDLTAWHTPIPNRTTTVQGPHVRGDTFVSAFPLPVIRLNGQYSYRNPVYVDVEQRSDGYMVTDTLTHRAGFGASVLEALADYREIVLEYFMTLRRERGHLSDRLRRHLHALERVIQER